jgi:hypothetical protein
MAHLNSLDIHDCKEIVIKERESEGVQWLTISFDQFDIILFDKTRNDLRVAVYRSEMEEYDANTG